MFPWEVLGDAESAKSDIVKSDFGVPFSKIVFNFPF